MVEKMEPTPQALTDFRDSRVKKSEEYKATVKMIATGKEKGATNREIKQVLVVLGLA